MAPLWNPNLNDGVIINFAPLWRLVPQHRAWQKECKSTWDKLCKGDYDWAHLAMHLWPERVVPKCAKDRSLAIAHGLEEIFWYEDSDGKWVAREKGSEFGVGSSEFGVQGAGCGVGSSEFGVSELVDKLVEERRSAAVKDALKSLLEAPALSGFRRQGAGTRKKAARGKRRVSAIAKSSRAKKTQSSPANKPRPSPEPRTLTPNPRTLKCPSTTTSANNSTSC